MRIRARVVYEDEDGIALYVTEDGSDSMLWIHGYSMDSTTWEGLWGLLPGWRHVGIDLPGHGGSRSIRPGERLTDLGSVVARVSRQAGAKHLIALSFGTMIALEAAMAAPEQFETLVLGAPVIAGARKDIASQYRYLQLRQLFERFGAGSHMTQLWMSSPPDIFKGTERIPLLREKLRTTIEHHRWEELRGDTMIGLAEPAQQRRELARIRARVLIILGEHEMSTFRECALILTETIERTTGLEIDCVGHLCLLEAPETVAPLIHAHAWGCLDTLRDRPIDEL